MNAIERLWNKVRVAFEAEGGLPAVDRAVSWGQISEMVYNQACDMYGEYPWVEGFYQEDGETFVIIARGGKLYRHMVMIDGDEATLGEAEPVMVNFNPVARATTTTIIRQADGRHRWFSVSCAATLNRVGEIDSRDLFDSFVAHAEETGEYPIRQFYHQGETFRTGQADYLARDENLYLTSGLYDDTDLARREVKAREADPDYWGDSIGYKPTAPAEMLPITDRIAIPVFRAGINKEISTLPENEAASLLTGGTIIYEVNRMLTGKAKDAFVKLFEGDESAADKWLEENAESRNRAIEAENLITRTDDAPKNPADEAPTEPPVVELDDAALTAIARTVENGEQFAALTANVTALAETVTALAATVAEMTTANTATATETQRRLKALEADEETKRQQWQEDLPGRQTLRVTHRPRSQNDPSQPALPGTDEGTMADQANKVLATIPQRY